MANTGDRSTHLCCTLPALQSGKNNSPLPAGCFHQTNFASSWLSTFGSHVISPSGTCQILSKAYVDNIYHPALVNPRHLFQKPRSVQHDFPRTSNTLTSRNSCHMRQQNIATGLPTERPPKHWSKNAANFPKLSTTQPLLYACAGSQGGNFIPCWPLYFRTWVNVFPSG